MNVLTLGVENSAVLSDLDNTEAGAMNLVVGNDDVKVLLNNLNASIRERLEDDSGYPYAITGNTKLGIHTTWHGSIWREMEDDAPALKLFYTLLEAVDSRFNKMMRCINGEFAVALKRTNYPNHEVWHNLDEMSDSFRFILETALEAYLPCGGLVVVHNVEQADVDNIGHLTDYLVNMAALRENRTVLSTQDMGCVKEYNLAMRKPCYSDIDNVFVALAGNTPSNCSILSTAVIDAELCNGLLSGMLLV